MTEAEKAKEIIRSVGKRRILREDEAKNILRCYGIPTTDFHVIKGLKDLEGLEVKFPAVLKLCSEDTLHKTEVGGVKLGITTMEALKAELKEMGERFPSADLLLEPMERSGVELIMGLSRDKTFDLTIMVGMGGIFTELYRDVSFRTVPISELDGREMLNDLTVSEVFKGFRGIEADMESAIDILLKLSRLGQDLSTEIDQMDLNPLFIRKEDAVVVDAKLLLK